MQGKTCDEPKSQRPSESAGTAASAASKAHHLGLFCESRRRSGEDNRSEGWGTRVRYFSFSSGKQSVWIMKSLVRRVKKLETRANSEDQEVRRITERMEAANRRMREQGYEPLPPRPSEELSRPGETAFEAMVRILHEARRRASLQNREVQ